MVTLHYQSGRDVDLRTRLLRLSTIWGGWNGMIVDGGRTASIANLTRFTGCLATRGASTDASGKANDATPGRQTIMERGPVDVVVLSRRRECACGLTLVRRRYWNTLGLRWSRGTHAARGALTVGIRVRSPVASIADAAVLSGLPRTSSSGNCGGQPQVPWV